MTATAQEYTVRQVPGELVQVRFTAGGLPLAVRWRDRIWPVAAEPLHWFERFSWWESGLGAAPGRGNLVDTECWRVQVRATPASPLRTVELRRYPGRENWILAV
ncbi:hypothetical protein HER39_19485 [Arthrobacter deserti]|uniref:Nucleotidyltransferase n=1 Tax=Arthrobacter deserti TaxID=1742687 RepID=A0ABX1JUQ9_9MICC|nr:hypothetical protein [Arthrobacter deserti]